MITDVFCKIINKELPADIIMEGENWVAINDIHPQAPIHVLILSKRHGPFNNYTDTDIDYLGKLLMGASKVAKKLGADKTGYRLIINYGEDSQAEVFNHLHIHLMGEVAGSHKL